MILCYFIAKIETLCENFKKLSTISWPVNPFIPLVHEAVVAQGLHLFIPVVEPCLGVRLACSVAQAILHVGINLLQALVRVYHRDVVPAKYVHSIPLCLPFKDTFPHLEQYFLHIVQRMHAQTVYGQLLALFVACMPFVVCLYNTHA